MMKHSDIKEGTARKLQVDMQCPTLTAKGLRGRLLKRGTAKGAGVLLTAGPLTGSRTPSTRLRWS